MSSVVEVTLSEGKVLRILGPARVQVLSGTLLVVGSKFVAGSSFVVHKYRSYGVKALSETKLKVTLGEGGRIEEAKEGEEVIDEWLRISELILGKCKRSQCKVLVVGPPDSGKSTLVAFFANYLREVGVRACVVEGDVGQEDIMVPTTVALAEVAKPVLWLRELDPSAFRFVGCTSPQHCYSESILAVKELVDEALKVGCGAVVINTDGWVSTASGIEHKLQIVRWVRPDIVVTTSRELYDYLVRSVKSFSEVLYAPRPAIVRERSREERRELRAEAYRRYLSKGRVRKVKLDEIGVVGNCVFSGRPLSREQLAELLKIPEAELNKVVYASRFGDHLLLVVREPLALPEGTPAFGKLLILGVRDMVGTIVGLLGEGMREVGVGVVLDVDLDARELAVLTPCASEIKGLILGKVRLGEEFGETGRVIRCATP